MTLPRPFQDPSCGRDVARWREHWSALYFIWYRVQKGPIGDMQAFGLLVYSWRLNQKLLYEYFKYSLITGIRSSSGGD